MEPKNRLMQSPETAIEYLFTENQHTDEGKWRKDETPQTLPKAQPIYWLSTMASDKY